MLVTTWNVSISDENDHHVHMRYDISYLIWYNPSDIDTIVPIHVTPWKSFWTVSPTLNVSVGPATTSVLSRAWSRYTLGIYVVMKLSAIGRIQSRIRAVTPFLGCACVMVLNALNFWSLLTPNKSPYFLCMHFMKATPSDSDTDGGGIVRVQSRVWTFPFCRGGICVGQYGYSQIG